MFLYSHGYVTAGTERWEVGLIDPVQVGLHRSISVRRRPYGGTWEAPARKHTMAQCWLRECLFYMFSIKVLKKNVTLIAQCWNTYRFWFRAILDVRIGPWRASTLQQGISTFLTRLGRRFHLTTGKCSSRAYDIFYPPCCMRCTFTITDRGAIWRTQRLRGHSLFIMWMQTVCHNRK